MDWAKRIALHALRTLERIIGAGKEEESAKNLHPVETNRGNKLIKVHAETIELKHLPNNVVNLLSLIAALRLVVVQHSHLHLAEVGGQHERSEELDHIVEGRSERLDLLHHIGDTDDVARAQVVLHHRVVGNGNALVVHLTITSHARAYHREGVLGEQLLDEGRGGGAPGHKRLHQNQIAHHLGRLADEDGGQRLRQLVLGEDLVRLLEHLVRHIQAEYQEKADRLVYRDKRIVDALFQSLESLAIRKTVLVVLQQSFGRDELTLSSPLLKGHLFHHNRVPILTFLRLMTSDILSAFALFAFLRFFNLTSSILSHYAHQPFHSRIFHQVGLILVFLTN